MPPAAASGDACSLIIAIFLIKRYLRALQTALLVPAVLHAQYGSASSLADALEALIECRSNSYRGMQPLQTIGDASVR